MIYTLNLKTNANPALERKVCLLFEMHTTNKETIFLNAVEVLNNLGLVATLDTAGCSSKVAFTEEVGVPFLVPVEEIVEVTDSTAIYGFISGAIDKAGTSELSPASLKIVTETLEKAGVGSNELCSAITEAVIEFIKFMKEKTYSTEFQLPLDKIDSLTFKETEDYFKRVNNEVLQIFTKMSEKDNITLKQNNCTDELFIYIPSPAELFDDETSIESILPKFGSVAIPYPDEYKAAYTDEYRESWNNIPSSFYPEIEGNPDNNSLPVQENEQRFYNALIDWITFISKRTYTGATEVTDETLVLDPLCQEWLKELMNTLYCWYWRHNPNVPDSVIYSDDSDEGTSDEESSKYAFRVKRGMEGNAYVLNALTMFHNFLDDVYKEKGYKVYVEAIIKLARWGTRKCSAIYFEDYPYMFNLNNCALEDYVGSAKDYEFAFDQNLNVMKATDLFMCRTELKDAAYFKGLGYNYSYLCAPIGVACRSIMVNKKRPESKLKVDNYYSLVDFVYNIFNGIKCAGVTIGEDGKIIAEDVEITKEITTDQLVSYVQNDSSKFLFDPIYVSPSLSMTYTEMNVLSNKPSHFSLLRNRIEVPNLAHSLSTNKVSSLSQLNSAYASSLISSRVSAVDYNVIGVILPIYVEVSKRFYSSEKKNFETLLNHYRDVMLEMNYEGENSFITERKVETTPFRKLVPGYKEVMEEPTDVVSAAEQLLANRNGMREFEVVDRMNTFSSEPAKEQDTAQVIEESAPVNQEPVKQSTNLIDTGATTEKKETVFRKHNPAGNLVPIKDVNKNVVGICELITVTTEVTGVPKKKTTVILLPQSAIANHVSSANEQFLPVVKVFGTMFINLYKREAQTGELTLYYENEETLQYFVKLFTVLAESKAIY